MLRARADARTFSLCLAARLTRPLPAAAAAPRPRSRRSFEKIQKAYDALTAGRPTAGAAEGAGAGPDAVSVLLLVRTQCILFARHGRLLKQYKYAGYPLVLGAVRAAGEPGERVAAGERASFLEAASRLVYLTCLATPKNADELIREGGVAAMLVMGGHHCASLFASAQQTLVLPCLAACFS